MEMYLLVVAVVNLVRSGTCPIYFQWGLRLVICAWCELGMHNLAEQFSLVSHARVGKKTVWDIGYIC